jgi:hypothetical protein
LFKTSGNPVELLKAVNPTEAQLMDSASNAHIRFRLGGDRFPPTIYYKIFVHGGIVDIGSFAPRDYASLKKGDKVPKKMFLKDYKNEKVYHDGWYLRLENNGWRPLQYAVTKKKEFVELTTANKVKYFHYNKEYRKQKNEKHKH